MSESSILVRQITSRASYWRVLEEALSHEGEDAPFSVDFSRAEWAKIKIVYRGRGYSASLTPSAMRGIIEVQASLYRSAAAIMYDGADGRKLTEADKEALELSFTIGKGSADTEGDGKGFLNKLAEAISTMSSKHKLVALLVAAPLFFGYEGFKIYVEDRSQHEDKDHLVELSNQIMNHDERGMVLLQQSMQQSPAAREVREQAINGFDAVVRNSGSATSMTVQGTRLHPQHLDEARKNPRNVSATFQVTEQFMIRGVDPRSPNGFTVRLQSSVSGVEYWASLFDTLASDRDRIAIRRAEWSKQPIVLTVTGRKVGQQIRDARIITTRVAAQPLLVSTPTIRGRRV